MEHESNDRRRRPTQTERAARPAQPVKKKRRTSPAALEAQRQREERRRAAAQQPEQPTSAPEHPRQTTERPRRQAEPERRQRVPSPARSSRAAQTAQRHREERKESNYLQGQRRKQQRQAKQRTRMRIGKAAWKRIAVMAGIVIAVVLSMVIFFRVQDVKVYGNSKYSAQQVVDACGVAKGDNLLTMSRGEVAGNVLAALPYVNTVQVTRQLPDTLVITVTEYETTFAMTDESGVYYLVTAGGKVAEKVNEKDARQHVVIQGATLQSPQVGQAASIGGGLTETVKAVMTELDAAELTEQITSVTVGSASKITAYYEDRFEVHLGSSERLAYKLEFLKTVIAQQKDYATGSIDLTLSDGDQAHVRLDS